ncbi:FHA domain-containing protein, partial [Streptomyces halstedii]|uniref:FHA domain-containing protein n=1 Tax=Streptomyces halstedii TaxID=1944 RepID=UPI00339E286E
MPGPPQSRPAAPTAPELVLETDIGSTVMSPSRDYHVGRDPESDIVIDDARVSWHHAVLHPDAGHWTLQDEASTNGTYTGGHRVHESGVGAGSIIHFGNPGDGPRAVLLGREPPARPATPDRPSAVSMPAAPPLGRAHGITPVTYHLLVYSRFLW